MVKVCSRFQSWTTSAHPWRLARMDPSQRLRGRSAQWPRLGEGRWLLQGHPAGCSRWASWRACASTQPRWQPSLKKSRASPCTSLPRGAYNSRIVFSTAAQWCILMLLATSTGLTSFLRQGGSLAVCVAWLVPGPDCRIPVSVASE